MQSNLGLRDKREGRGGEVNEGELLRENVSLGISGSQF